MPYLPVDPAEVAAWASRFSPLSVNVGLVWAGSPGHAHDGQRSMPLAALAPLGAVDGVSLFSLQKGPAEAHIRDAPAAMRLRELPAPFDEFADMAAAIMALDLVITVDTSVAHLAGALGKPVWILLSHRPDWRWLSVRQDSPWYPTARLFRQPRPGAWDAVVVHAAAELQRLAVEQRPQVAC